MTSTLTPTCSVCGLRFENRPLLELHVREDHRKRGNPARSAASRLRHRSPANRHGESPAAPAATAGPGTGGRRPPGRPRAGRAMTALRRVAGAFRHANAELLLTSQAMRRLPGDPRRPADPPAGRDNHPAAAGHRADRAA